MSKLSDLRQGAAKAWPFQTLPPLNWSAQEPTYRDADPAVIRAAVARAQRRPSGNWFVFAASSQIATKAWGTTVGGVEIVAWRAADGGLRVALRACPHLGADLATATVECGTLVCPWHGMRLTDRSRGAWQPFPAYDDGVLCWVRLDAVGKEEPTDAPIIPTRPPDRGWPRSPDSKVSVSLAMSSPTGWIRGTTHGFTRIPSPGCRCSARRPLTQTCPTSTTASSSPSRSGWAGSVCR